MNAPSVSKTHRTALVIDVSKAAQAAPDFKERVDRLLQSVNGSNIKCDVYNFDGVTLRPGVPAEGVTSDGAETSLEAWANEAGYTQLLISRPGKVSSLSV